MILSHSLISAVASGDAMPLSGSLSLSQNDLTAGSLDDTGKATNDDSVASQPLATSQSDDAGKNVSVVDDSFSALLSRKKASNMKLPSTNADKEVQKQLSYFFFTSVLHFAHNLMTLSHFSHSWGRKDFFKINNRMDTHEDHLIV